MRKLDLNGVFNSLVATLTIYGETRLVEIVEDVRCCYDSGVMDYDGVRSSLTACVTFALHHLVMDMRDNCYRCDFKMAARFGKSVKALAAFL